MNHQTNVNLRGRTVVITRAAGQQGEATSLLKSFGAVVLDLPALIIGPPDNFEKLDEAVKSLDDFEWIIFSSANGVQSFQQRLSLLNKTLKDKPKSLKIAVVGRKTAKFIEHLGVMPDFIPADYIADSLVEGFPSFKQGSKILLPRVQSGGRSIIADSLKILGADIKEVAAYESYCPPSMPIETANALSNGVVDIISFTSGKTVSHTASLLLEKFGEDWKDLIEKVKLVSIGPQTTKSCRKFFNRVDAEAKIYDIRGLIDACDKSLKS
tara:strand:- start:8623 stop:9426 length:804 start_codon:yes stop_codon:yes gene_type:complete